MQWHILCLKGQKDDENDSFSEVLSGSQFKAKFIAPLAFTFVNGDKLHDAIANRHAEYGGLILTSQRSIEAITTALNVYGTLENLERWKSKPTFVVGPACSAEATRLGLCAQGAESGNADALARFLISAVGCTSQPLLFPCGNLRRDTLPAALTQHGVPYQCLTVYETGPNPTFTSDLCQYMSELEQVTNEVTFTLVMVFFSPSGVQQAVAAMATLPRPFTVNVKHVAIGPTTAEALEKAGLAVSGTCQSPTAHCLLQILTSLTDANINQT